MIKVKNLIPPTCQPTRRLMHWSTHNQRTTNLSAATADALADTTLTTHLGLLSLSYFVGWLLFCINLILIICNKTWNLLVLPLACSFTHVYLSSSCWLWFFFVLYTAQLVLILITLVWLCQLLSIMHFLYSITMFHGFKLWLTSIWVRVRLDSD